jgi:hypothetical protein
VAHACDPSYSGGSDQKDRGLKPAQANSSQDPISKKFFTKKMVQWLKVEALSSNPSTTKKKKKTKKKYLTRKKTEYIKSLTSLYDGGLIMVDVSPFLQCLAIWLYYFLIKYNC